MRSFVTRLLIALGAGLLAGGAALAQDILEPEKAFKFSVQALDDRTIEVRYRIEDGYYMYRDKFKFAVEPASARLGVAEFPAGEVKQDEFFGRVETYRKGVAIRIPVEAGAEAVTLAATSQGCADIGICYPPITQSARIVLAAVSGGGSVMPDAQSVAAIAARSGESPDQFVGRPVSGQPGLINDETKAAGILAGGSLWAIVAFFFAAGLLLTFTPCVLPMIPILSGIIVGEGREASHKGRALALSLAYVAGMAIAYTALGVAAGLAGSMFGGALQNPWVLTAFAAIFVALAFSMFGFYDITLPAVLHTRLAHASHRLTGGHLGAVALMGVLSAAIVSPCVAAPLAGALVYISQSRDVVLGGTALFAMSIGMGVPLVAVGVTEGALLPRSGHWMKSVKKFFGFLMLGVAIWIVAPIIPVVAQMLLWAALLIIGAMYLHALDPLPHDASDFTRFWKGVGVISLLAGGALALGAFSGHRDILQPLSGFRVADGSAVPAGTEVRFERVRSLADLETRLAQVSRPVMLDFYADWCVSCKEMERFTFSDARVREKFAGMVLLQADVTANSDDDKALLKRFGLFGPPGIIFFDRQGREIDGLRVIGYQPADRFLKSLARATGT
ncbi:MAG: protein-disulfide reductase DsbD [Burkholderiales bacterium]|nr:protein-disulfide reductase DsbD [Burkholderiales bacterium]